MARAWTGSRFVPIPPSVWVRFHRLGQDESERSSEKPGEEDRRAAEEPYRVMRPKLFDEQ